ncbi:hypothetical protein I302_109129 [Kwoniella bestiolae CBS 10118]|uniref:Uncharacterized protein n=1 Tax=Kwoniella bestiolae CBS 10118 TaxID=1296100 RepID=A0A1B9FV35_9TREE|nr:hypothetical protein I302_08275 [Kwoniella bestiolae CBS 10118]OCF22624.1 hypothetical protein I302_08275 [Kwoniella bestiolae CBS 10118]
MGDVLRGSSSSVDADSDREHDKTILAPPTEEDGVPKNISLARSLSWPRINASSGLMASINFVGRQSKTVLDTSKSVMQIVDGRLGRLKNKRKEKSKVDDRCGQTLTPEADEMDGEQVRLAVPTISMCLQ